MVVRVAAARAFRKHLQDAPEPLDEAGDVLAYLEAQRGNDAR
jgi:hypothetical protein